jgi:hypothetical protein
MIRLDSDHPEEEPDRDPLRLRPCPTGASALEVQVSGSEGIARADTGRMNKTEHPLQARHATSPTEYLMVRAS